MTRRKIAPVRTRSYPEFLRSLNLISISLIKSNFAGDREQYFKNREHRLSVLWKSGTVESGDEFFEVRVDVVVKLASPKSDRVFFDLTASYLLHIHFTSPANPEHVARFTDSEVRLLIWPYVREYVSSISGRMHVPPIVLPLTGSGEE